MIRVPYHVIKFYHMRAEVSHDGPATPSRALFAWLTSVAERKADRPRIDYHRTDGSKPKNGLVRV